MQKQLTTRSVPTADWGKLVGRNQARRQGRLKIEDATVGLPIGNPSYVAVPQTPTATVASGGSLAVGDWYYCITAINQYGETTPSAEVKVTVAAGSRVTLTWTEGPLPSPASYRIYRGRQTGVYTEWYGKDRFGAGSSGNWVDTGSLFPSSYGLSPIAPPSINLAVSPGPEYWCGNYSNNLEADGCARLLRIKQVRFTTRGPGLFTLRLIKDDGNKKIPADAQISLYQEEFSWENTEWGTHERSSGWLDAGDLQANESITIALYARSYYQFRPYVRVECLYDDLPDTRANAQYTIMIAADSISSGFMGKDAAGVPWPGRQYLWPHQLQNALIAEGHDVRLVNKAKPATFGVAGGYMAKYDTYYDNVDYDLLIVSFGMNDAGKISCVNVLDTWLKEFIRHRDRFRPEASILFIAPTNSDEAPRVPNLPAVRQKIKDVATDATLGGIGRKVYFYDASQAFPLSANAATDTNYSDVERASGSRLHPSGLGQLLMFRNTSGDVHNNIPAGMPSGIWEIVKRTDFYQNI